MPVFKFPSLTPSLKGWPRGSHLKVTRRYKVGLKHCLLLTTYYVVYTLIWEDWTHTHARAHARTHTHTREKEVLGPPTNVQRCSGSFALRNRDRAERERAGGILWMVNVGDNFTCLKYFIAVIPNRYLRKINTEVKDLSQDDWYVSVHIFKWVYANPGAFLVGIRHIPAYHVDYTTAYPVMW